MAQLSININLISQEERKYKTFFLVLGIIGVLWLITVLVFPDLRLSPFIWLPILPSIIESILYGLGRRGVFVNTFPYLRINGEKIESFQGGFFSEPKVVEWKNVKKVEIKLFEILITDLHQKEHAFDLTGLTDDNLKLVKEFVASLQIQNKI